jgi:hypothetical protein
MRLGNIDERKLTGGEKRSKEAHFKKLKKHKKDFTDRYGDEGESVMHAIATKRAKGESVEAEGYEILPRMDREKYQKRPGLEGPIMTRSGKTVYYDTKQGMYYDPDTDMYISYDDWKMLDSPNMHKVSEKDSIKPFDTISARAIRDLKQRYPHAKDPVNALVLDIEKNEMDSDRADDEADEERESIMSRLTKIEKELGIKESSAQQASMNVLNKLEYIVKN